MLMLTQYLLLLLHIKSIQLVTLEVAFIVKQPQETVTAVISDCSSKNAFRKQEHQTVTVFIFFISFKWISSELLDEELHTFNSSTR